MILRALEDFQSRGELVWLGLPPVDWGGAETPMFSSDLNAGVRASPQLTLLSSRRTGSCNRGSYFSPGCNGRLYFDSLSCQKPALQRFYRRTLDH